MSQLHAWVIGLTSVSHMDFPKAVDKGLSQMLSLLIEDGAALDVHLIGGYDDAPVKGANGNSGSGRKRWILHVGLLYLPDLIEAQEAQMKLMPAYWYGIGSSLQQLSDDEMVFRCSTSPYAEAPDFVDNESFHESLECCAFVSDA